MLYIIVGSKGQLGSEFVRLLKDEGETYIALDLPEIDITNFDEATNVLFDRIMDSNDDRKVILNCAAYTDVEKAEEQKIICHSVNTFGAENLSKLSKMMDGEVVYFSTDYVFNGKKNTPYVETDVPDPLNYYGMTKLEGERMTAENNPNHYILRISWLYGPDGQNFVKKISGSARTRKELKVVNDQSGCPTYTKDVVQQTMRLLKSGIHGLFHSANTGQATWFTFTKAIIEAYKIDCEVKPCTSTEFVQKALRPAHSVLLNQRLQQTGLECMRPWSEAFRDFSINYPL